MVIKRSVAGVGETYWSNVSFGGEKSPSIEDAYPLLNGMSYSDIVVEIDGNQMDHEKDFMSVLEGISTNVLEEKLKRIEEVRSRYLYDFDGNSSQMHFLSCYKPCGRRFPLQLQPEQHLLGRNNIISYSYFHLSKQ